MGLTLDGGLGFASGGGGAPPPKYVYTFIPLAGLFPDTNNFSYFSAPDNNEVDIHTSHSVTPALFTGLVDTSQFSQARLIGHVIIRGPDASIVRVKYSTTNDDADYHQMGQGGATLDITTDVDDSWVDSGWLDLDAGAIASTLYLRLFSVNQGNDSVNFAVLIPLDVWFR